MLIILIYILAILIMLTDKNEICNQTEALYRRHHGWLFNLLYRRLGCKLDAEDLAHDAFVRLLKRPRCFDSFDGSRAYLSTMARGLCVDLWRRREIEQAYLDILANQPESVCPSAEQQSAIIQLLCEIDKILSSQPVKAANAFIMAVIQGYTDKEVADKLGVSDRMVRKYVARVMLACVVLDIHSTN